MTPKNTFKHFYDTLASQEQKELAGRAGTSIAYLYQIANGYRRPGASVSARLKAADGRITDAMLRPDLYAPAA
jgi:transcriptional regulator with XRE-family HTH domain